VRVLLICFSEKKGFSSRKKPDKEKKEKEEEGST
jgi:hypothetical protein